MEMRPLRPLPAVTEADGETLADMGVADPPHEPDVVPPPDETP